MRKKKPIAVCAITTWPPHMDGVALYSMKLYAHIANYCDVTILCNKIQGVRVASIISEGIHRKVVGCWERKKGLHILRLLEYIIRYSPNVVHIQFGWKVYGSSFSLLALLSLLTVMKLMRKPVVITMHTVIKRGCEKNVLKNYLSLHFHALGAILIPPFIKLLSTLVNCVIVHNELMSQELLTGYGVNNVHVIPHGSDRAMNETIKKYNADDAKIILFLGFVRPNKGLGYLIRAFLSVKEKLKKVKLIVVGGRHEHDDPWYFYKIKKLSRDVTFTGFLPNEEVNELINMADVIVLPYIDDGFIEVSGVVSKILDYGKPIVCTKIPKFLGELVDGVDAIMVEERNVEHLANAIIELLENPLLAEVLGSALHEKAKYRYWDLVAEEHLTLYHKLYSR